MARRAISLMLLLSVHAHGADSVKAPATGLRFELVSEATSLNRDETENEDKLVPCLFGEHPPGLRVLVVPNGNEPTCWATTGRVGSSVNGRCTVLDGIEGCRPSFNALGVIGSAGALRRVDIRPVTDAAARKELEERLRRAEVAEAAMRKWKTVFLEGRRVDNAVNDAVSFPEFKAGPTLVRLTLPEAPGGVDGPWVSASQWASGPLVGPFSMGRPEGFVLDGRRYVRFAVAACTECGGVGTELHAAEGGALRQVLVSYANSN